MSFRSRFELSAFITGLSTVPKILPDILMVVPSTSSHSGKCYDLVYIPENINPIFVWLNEISDIINE
jgi:hypothetical protein